MTPEQTQLLERVLVLLAHQPSVRVVPMFGVRSVMVNEKMIASALKNGSLLVRVNAGRHDELLGRPGAVQAVMGPGRDMGPGWIEVSADAVGAGKELAFWIDVALEYNRTVTGS